MRKLFVIAALTLALPIIAQAQDSPRTEIFGGYSYLRLDEDLNDDRDLNGYNASVNQTIFKKWLGFKADFSGHFGDSVASLGPGTDLNKFLFLFGPQFTLRKYERIQPFAHVLFGAARVDITNDNNGLDFDDNAFALAAGGGVDVKIADRVAVRLFQADYVLTRFNDFNQHNFRASGGFVLRFGSVE
ncbi:MAG TPA: outer membrane beta-barrel protein [Blastocatellia bacterium]|nr:outer membrane beta-barrel protein [Blastocatellia bacterium]